ncbi:MAG: CNNM domain-containing protein [Cognaticolwellia sp.]
MTLLFIYLAIAIGVSFLCSVLEAVLLSITPSFVEQMKTNNPKSGAVLAKVKTRLDESLSSILILNTFAHTMGAAGVGAQAIHLFGEQWETLIALLLTLIILYLSEIIPKTLGANFWRALAIPSAYVISWLIKIVYPLVWLATRLTSSFKQGKDNEITREEIIALASLSHKDGSLFSQENEYLSNMLKLRELRTGEVFTPRTVVHMLHQDITVTEALNHEQTAQFTRIPIYGKTVDDIKGKVIKGHLYEAERNGRGDEAVINFAIPLASVSEKLPVQQLLDMFIKNHVQMYSVEDEYGQTSGVVTLEDAIETLLGREIVDESDVVTDMQALARDKYRERLREIKQQDNEPKE